jgi:DNA modification methylase
MADLSNSKQWPPSGVDWYYSDSHTAIACGDCLEILPHLEPVDLVLTDPPYGVSGVQNTTTAKRRGGRKNDYIDFVDGSDMDGVVELVTVAIGMASRAVVTPGNKWLTEYPSPSSFGVFYQPASVGLQPWGRADSQPILYYGKSPNGGQKLLSTPCSFVLTESPQKNGHPCPKPYNAWLRLAKLSSRPGETILDPFMGSGTTLVAAKELGRKAIGIEISKEYCDIAVKRLRHEVLF